MLLAAKRLIRGSSAGREASGRPLSLILSSSSPLSPNDNTWLKRETPPPNMQCRSLSIIPEVLQHVSIWGGSGVLLKTFHVVGIPFWGAFGCANVVLRVSLSPLVIHSAHVAARFAKVAPEVQFLVSLFQNDLMKQRQEGAPFGEQRILMFKTLLTLSGIYKLHKINPLAVFLSPLLQIPFFMYMSTDLRKIINGADPELAQLLTEGGILWFRDLTEPDAWYALPIIGGLLLYYNVEVAIGKQTLSGEAASKSNVALYLKDFFQSLAVFMPCFMSQSPAGIQIYLIASFIFTYFQGQALRNDTCRGMVGLPLKQGPTQKPEAKYAMEFIELKRLEQKAIEARGDGDLLGKGVLASGLEVSFAGTNRPSAIKGSGIQSIFENINTKVPHMNVAPPIPIGNAPFVHGISAPPKEFDSNTTRFDKTDEPAATSQPSVTVKALELDIERANRGLAPIQIVNLENTGSDKPLNIERFKKSGKHFNKAKKN
jgi:membrane protein insertase Oxa1/YidC/SpoIIIJ